MSRLDRRALFTSGAAAALLAATGVSVQAAPRRGGRLRLAVPRADERFDIAVRGSVYETLTEVGPDGLLRGELAVSWTSHAAGREWILQLRRDARFHDGEMFTSGDAARILSAQVGFASDLDTPDPFTLWLLLDEPDPQLPYLLADPNLAIVRDDPRSQLPVGTGLYQTQRYQPDRHFLGRRIEPHYKDGAAGWFDEVEIAVIPDAAVRAEALRDGFVDVADVPQASGLGDTSALILRPDARTIELAARNTVGVPKQLSSRAPLDDGRIAQRWWMT